MCHAANAQRFLAREKKLCENFPIAVYTHNFRYAHTSATVCTVGLHAHLLLSTLHVLSVGFAVVLGTNNMSNTELVVQGIESVIGTNTTANHALIVVSKLHAS